MIDIKTDELKELLLSDPEQLLRAVKELIEQHNIPEYKRDKVRGVLRIAHFATTVLQDLTQQSVAESLLRLDSDHLYFHILEALMSLSERLVDPQGEKQHNDAEIRGVFFLYNLVRFVYACKRFPRSTEMYPLLSGTMKLPSLENSLEKTLRTSPQVRSQVKDQERHRTRNSVGIGDNSGD